MDFYCRRWILRTLADFDKYWFVFFQCSWIDNAAAKNCVLQKNSHSPPIESKVMLHVMQKAIFIHHMLSKLMPLEIRQNMMEEKISYWKERAAESQCERESFSSKLLQVQFCAFRPLRFWKRFSLLGYVWNSHIYDFSRY